MLSRLLVSLVCVLPLAAQAPTAASSPVQDSIKAARSAAKSGDIDDARTQYQTAFGLAIENNAALASGIAVQLADLLEENKQPLPALAFLMDAASQLENGGADAQVQVPLANRLSHIAGTLISGGNASDAKPALEKSLAIVRTAYGPDALCVSNALALLARADHKLGDDTMAVQESTEAQRIREKNQGDPATMKRVDASMTPPRVTYKIDPSYSDQARAAQLNGTVMLSVIVAPDGAAKDIQVERPLGSGLDQAAIDAVEQWKFKPAVLKADGQPVPVQATIEVNFRLL